MGFVQVNLRELLPVPIMVSRYYAYIEDIAVLNTSHRHGIGLGLMTAAERRGKDKVVTAIELNVWDFDKRAIALKKAMGYSMASHRMCKLTVDNDEI